MIQERQNSHKHKNKHEKTHETHLATFLPYHHHKIPHTHGHSDNDRTVTKAKHTLRQVDDHARDPWEEFQTRHEGPTLEQQQLRRKRATGTKNINYQVLAAVHYAPKKSKKRGRFVLINVFGLKYIKAKCIINHNNNLFSSELTIKGFEKTNGGQSESHSAL